MLLQLAMNFNMVCSVMTAEEGMSLKRAAVQHVSMRHPGAELADHC